MELYKQGLSDRQIGKLQGVTGNAIHLWRKNHGLKANWAVKKAESKMGLYKVDGLDWMHRHNIGCAGDGGADNSSAGNQV